MTFMQKLLKQAPVNVSRRGFLSGTGALVLSTTLPVRPSKAQEAEAAAGPAVPAFLEIHEDGTVDVMFYIDAGSGFIENQKIRRMDKCSSQDRSSFEST